MKRTPFVLIGAATLLLAVTIVTHAQQIPLPILISITRAEDERRWDKDLSELLAHRNAAIRKRALLAAGRIGNEDRLPQISKLLQDDADPEVRAMAAFAIGEVESINAAHLLVEIIKANKERGELRARALEALGKIAAALPTEQQARQRDLGAVIREALEVEAKQPTNQLNILFGLTAALRARAADAGPAIAKFLSSPDGRIRSDAGNALARLRLKDGNDLLRKLAYEDPDPNVRANAARVLGATEDTASFDVILGRATSDPDSRVRISSIRALATLKDSRAAEALLKRYSTDQNERLEIATTLGRLLSQKYDQPAIAWLQKANETLKHTAPEIEIALVRIAPATYLSDLRRSMNITDWRAAAAIANALAEIGGLPDTLKAQSDWAASAESLVRKLLAQTNIDYAIPDVLRALAAFKPKDLPQVLIAHLQKPDVIVRGTAADLLGDQPPSEEITSALIAAWPRVEKDSLNDAALSILDSLAKQKTAAANEPIKMAMGFPDYLVRRRAATLLKANGTGDFFRQAGIVQTRNTTADYRRALSRIGRKVYAVVTTTKGSFTIELLPSEAPLTVDNFVQLARRNYYRGITIHRVVPNFVIQDGDPRGDGNGGPGYQIRCEINQVPYDRAVLGMALSGKDTGGSQWFVTHAPQPHLDGGYTVFGRITAGMNVVDSIERGDVVKSIVIR
ncbi:MAG: peptidylprolyl isomerase [Acidobacteria bacterium]|nr:peptidylprolyl isomerase [Acidobacteriota bacterium]MCA1627937.1 peptidylprolyl isomerase [Acidobacteriota bacterium]